MSTGRNTMRRLAPLLLACPLLAAAATPTLKEVDRIHIGGEARWDYLTVDSAAHRLYVSHASQTEVIDTRTDQLAGHLTLIPNDWFDRVERLQRGQTEVAKLAAERSLTASLGPRDAPKRPTLSTKLLATLELPNRHRCRASMWP